MAERFTRRSQKPMGAIPCGFESHLAYKMREVASAYDWTPNLAYVIGLLTTDGSLSNDGRHISFRSSDRQLIETFESCLQTKQKIAETKKALGAWAVKPSYRIQYSNVRFYRWLLTIGLTPAKTHTIGSIKIPDKYFRDFMRGHLDGDGTVRTYTDSYNIYRGRKYTNERLATFFLSASFCHIMWVQDKIQELTGCHGAIIVEKNIRGTCLWKIKYSKKESLILLKWLYYRDNLPCLERKATIARKALLKFSRKTRKQYEKVTIR